MRSDPHPDGYRTDPEQAPDGERKRALPDSAQPTEESVRRLLTTIAGTYLTQHDVERWVAARLATWYRQLRASTVGECRAAWAEWERGHHEPPTLQEYLDCVMVVRSRRDRAPGEPCDDCRGDGGRRTVYVVVVLYDREVVRTYMCRCDCEAGRRYPAWPEWRDVAERWRASGHRVATPSNGISPIRIEAELLRQDLAPTAPMPEMTPEEMAANLRGPPRARDWNEAADEWETGGGK